MNKTYYQQIDETVYHSTLANGLNLFIIPKKDFQKTFVTYTTQFGSLDHRFKPHGADEFVSVPDGVAHFLEHKLFEKEEGDLFTEFAEHDAQVNAFTSFDRTSYLFSATNHIDDNILRLLKMVESPYFSEASVEKEKGIIAEEIKMYQEQPGYRLMFNTLRAMYQDHPVRVDIAGSVESIYEITKDDLYLCYETFYHPSNMVLFVVGDVDPEHIENLVRTHEDARGIVAQPEIERDPLNEPIEVIEHQVVESMALQSPRIMLGLKHPVYDLSRHQGVKEDIEMSFFFEMIYGEETNFYQSLLSQDLIDDTFSYQTVIEPTYSFSLITSAATEPEQLKTLLLDELRARIGTLDDQHAFDLLKRQFIGEYISSLNAPEYIANQSTKFYFDGVSLFELLNVIDSITLDTMNETVRRRIDMNALVDSRLEIKKS
ncbi:TPA: insulinase family protein [Staphylococcus pseudintermedius]|uniref:EF-P 5-aminopentanol modification-associated protein YfmH n=1 Tax=Staphylococcus pseudintermedius TaxID=283734 RepID=UPI0018EF3974|nr:pitrilysin family protein [Staphylococcus pseudintermedius]QQJ45923.1 insulinase family protein [Staphylococcus pseudintermedius]QQJ48066.1 insulinase family protein [Staphylococcus pseudintermedius]QQJ50213.1 insulinase family protein [Staphylococcus pseudintermedius]QQJ55800.1 insulinase family protein [Staphylococcus pseudintermedius]QQJ56744.1 insulinase family protein [Staphylococcus pseudintermedius]